jgi:uncharacterized protein RhaS with RHS repeats
MISTASMAETTPAGTVSYGYDAAGRRTRLSVSGQADVLYAYDAADRLTQIAQGTNVVTFAYGNANRRTKVTLPNNVLVARRRHCGRRQRLGRCVRWIRAGRRQ